VTYIRLLFVRRFCMIAILLRTALIAAASIVLASGCSSSSDTDTGTVAGSSSSVAPDSPSTSQPSTDEGAGAETEPEPEPEPISGCTPPEDGDELRDQDMSDHQVPWERKGADKVAIYLESGDVTDEYRSYLDEGAAAWNRSPCLDVRIVDACPEEGNCVTVSLTPGDDADGNFDSIEDGSFTIGGHIDLFHEELDKLGDGAKLNVTIHEMGHAVGLRHRETERVLMNGDTYTDIFDPDETDFYNLRLLYGTQP